MGADEDRPLFHCGSQDLDEFFHEDPKLADKELVAVTYAVEMDGSTVAFFCVSNDSIRAEDTTPSRFKKIRSSIPAAKRYANMPAVKIGRLATNSDFQSHGIGTRILDLIKVWFTEGNKTGCRFIIVDAANNERTLNFYERNGFQFLDTRPETVEGRTRLMFFDLLTFRE